MKRRLVYLIGALALACMVALFLAALPTRATLSGRSSTIAWTDNFDSPSLNSRWSWIRQDPARWSLTATPGFLRITTQAGTLLGNSNDGKNLLVQDAPSGGFEIRTRLIFTPTQNYQIAGILVYQDDDNFLLLGRAYCGNIPSPCVGSGIYFDHEEQGAFIGSNYAMTTTVTGGAYLRLMRQGIVYSGYVSPNGTDWTVIGAHTVISGLVPSKVGLAAYNQSDDAAHIPADFDFFQLADNPSYLFLPVIMR